MLNEQESWERLLIQVLHQTLPCAARQHHQIGKAVQSALPVSCMQGAGLLDPATLTCQLLAAEYEAVKSDTWSSKDMLQLIRAKAERMPSQLARFEQASSSTSTPQGEHCSPAVTRSNWVWSMPSAVTVMAKLGRATRTLWRPD